MRVAVTVWGDRISPVFDSARQLLIADIETGKVSICHLEPIDPERSARVAERLKTLDVSVLICGAISQELFSGFDSFNITLIPFIGGITDDILALFAKGMSIIPGYSMPGCNQKLYGRNRTFDASWDHEEVKKMPKGRQNNQSGRGQRKGKDSGGCSRGKGNAGSGRGNGGGTGQGKGRGGQGRGGQSRVSNS